MTKCPGQSQRQDISYSRGYTLSAEHRFQASFPRITFKVIVQITVGEGREQPELRCKTGREACKLLLLRTGR